jgi:hypothetical protein
VIYVKEYYKMITDCQHLYCAKCILNCIKQTGVCPKDNFPISLGQLIEPIKLVQNMLEDFKIKFDFESDGCQQVLV